ncbi:MAG: DUF2157 domain-containing protein [Hyphomonadaceae bacterium]
MRDGAYLKRLEADLARWREAALITDEQSAALEAHARARAAAPARSMVNVFSVLGAVLFGLGVITFIGANWGLLAKALRMLAVLALLWLSFAAATWARERGARGQSEAYALIGALAIGAAIGLVGQTYHIAGTAAGLFALWSVFTFAAAIVYSSRVVLILSVILAFCYFVFARGDHFFFDHGPSERASLALFGLPYLPLWFAGAFLGRRWDSGAAMHFSGVAAMAWLFALLADSIWLDRARDWITAGLLIAASGAAIGAAGEVFRARSGDRAGAIALAWGAAIFTLGALMTQFAVWDQNDITLKMACAAVLLAVCVWAIGWGDATGRKAVRALAVALFAFECFYVYAALFGGLMNTALFLLGGGVVLMGMAFALRQLTRKPASPAAP